MTTDTQSPRNGPGTAGGDIERLAFDDALAELQRTVEQLEAGGQPLEVTIALYERGVALQERCAQLLTQAELHVQRLSERSAGALRAVDVPAGEVEPDAV